MGSIFVGPAKIIEETVTKILRSAYNCYTTTASSMFSFNTLSWLTRHWNFKACDTFPHEGVIYRIIGGLINDP